VSPESRENIHFQAGAATLFASASRDSDEGGAMPVLRFARFASQGEDIMAFGRLALIGLCAGLGLGLSACATTPDYVTAAIADPGRPAADTARDAGRKPADMLAFAEVRQGERLVDLIPGGGYFTRLFAKAVGPAGRVYAYVPAELDPLMKKPSPIIELAAQKDYANVVLVHEPVSSFVVAEPVDLVWTAQNYHDLHDKFFGPVDTDKLNKAIFKALKPGGLYVVLDHAAQAGSGLRDTDTLHRIDEEQVKREVLAAGFVLVGESDVLRNPNDPRTKLVFDPSIRGHTDQFILKFRKPRS
jgi:predicted methyltransferase